MDQIEKTAQVLNSGGIIIFPTETVLGIGCLIDKPEAINKLYQIKQRDQGKSTHVLVKDLDMAKDWVDFNHEAVKLVAKFWPGPLTICLPPKENVPKALLGASSGLGVRQSPNQFINELFERVSVPILAPSANFQDEPAPKKVTEIDKSLADKVNYVVPIEADGNLPSTVIVFADNQYNLVRSGQITKELLDKVLAEV